MAVVVFPNNNRNNNISECCQRKSPSAEYLLLMT